jgi:hypothetical protein
LQTLGRLTAFRINLPQYLHWQGRFVEAPPRNIRDERRQGLARLEDTGDQRAVDNLLTIAGPPMQRVEDRYGGPAGLGPYDDFEWGMLNGKLSCPFPDKVIRLRGCGLGGSS